MFFNTVLMMTSTSVAIDDPSRNSMDDSDRLRDAVSERLVAAVRLEPGKLWHRRDVGRLLIHVLVAERFDFDGLEQLEKLKRLLIETYAMAHQIVPADRRKF